MYYKLTKIGIIKFLKGIIIPAMVILLMIPSESFSQLTGKIAGRVTERTSGSVLIGANIIILNTTIGTAADQQGNYTISRIEPGTYKIKASYLGYQAQIFFTCFLINMFSR